MKLISQQLRLRSHNAEVQWSARSICATLSAPASGRQPSEDSIDHTSSWDPAVLFQEGGNLDSATPGQRLRKLIDAGPQMVPGAFNALTARMIERWGFPALYVSGAAVSASTFAIPDIGLLTLTEVSEQTRSITSAVSIPAIVDADTGFGEAVNVERTVRTLESAGAAAIQIEDQRLPKRCGHLSGKDLVLPHEMAAKILAAVAARRTADFLIIARTDARGVTGFDDAVARAHAYRAAGADVIFPEALETAEEFLRFRRAVDGPLVANLTEFGKSPPLAFDELAGIGYSLVLFPVTLLRLAMRAIEEGLAEIRSTGTQRNLLGRMQTRQELYDILGYSDYEQRDRAYFQSGTL
jgi:methylisocitrate lyase